jgi:hypothetical protein
LEINLISITAAAENGGIDQYRELSLDARRANVEVLGDISMIPSTYQGGALWRP